MSDQGVALRLPLPGVVSLGPGLLLTGGLALVAFGIRALPGAGLLSPLMIAIVLGMVYHNTLATPAAALAGVKFAQKRILRFAIALLGLQLTAQQVVAVGAGGLAVIADLPKTTVYALSRWLNAHAGRMVIPETVLTKAPTAELRPGQTDQDSLPPYEVLDDILECLVEKEMRVSDIVARGYDIKYVRLVADAGNTLGRLRNHSIDLATGDWCIQWDDDEWYHPWRIERQASVLGRRSIASALRWTLMSVERPVTTMGMRMTKRVSAMPSGKQMCRGRW